MNTKCSKLRSGAAKLTGWMLISLGILLLVTFFSGSAFAALHGISQAKGCELASICDGNEDCDDGLECTDEICDNPGRNTTGVCDINVGYNDGISECGLHQTQLAPLVFDMRDSVPPVSNPAVPQSHWPYSI